MLTAQGTERYIRGFTHCGGFNSLAFRAERCPAYYQVERKIAYQNNTVPEHD